MTKNNEKTIQNTLQSIEKLNARIIVGDLGSSDNTIKLCEKNNIEIHKLKGCERDKARNFLSTKTKDIQFYIEPWEILIKSGDFSKNSYVKILNNKTLTWEIRVWKNALFENPIFEQLDIEADVSNIVLASNKKADYSLEEIKKWQTSQPTSPKPYYYHAFCLLELGKLDEFLTMADYFLFINKKPTMSSVMIRYYYALVQLMYKKDYKKALQMINICLGIKPLMAEFWCLTGDVYYHLLKNFVYAKEFYDNAMIMGAKRLSTDIYPMDITKYKEYPLKMIKSCQMIIDSISAYQ